MVILILHAIDDIKNIAKALLEDKLNTLQEMSTTTNSHVAGNSKQ